MNTSFTQAQIRTMLHLVSEAMEDIRAEFQDPTAGHDAIAKGLLFNDLVDIRTHLEGL